MDPVVLDSLPFRINRDALLARVGIARGSGLDEELDALAAQAELIAKPKALFRPSFIDSRDDDRVVIEGITFTSRILSVNLMDVHRVFAYVLSCGMEIQEWAASLADPLQQFWVEAMKAVALRAATEAFEKHIVDAYRVQKSSRMNPGSLPDWPLEEQKPLFALFEDATSLIGVVLTESCVMIPNKTVSGIRFPTESSFESCQLCPRELCPGRRAEFDGGLFDRKYRKQARAGGPMDVTHAGENET